eukprot:TRINITY_DN9774_c0_g1_i1.p1 TRINITY_DN9774_c0_g1~~TRINITY_DN9774_c0_g1_i1.p1  ORF type:complete len:438 (+),score=61.95 TRINITY_DN9774_c0_g1_i1:33-1346(+)
MLIRWALSNRASIRAFTTRVMEPLSAALKPALVIQAKVQGNGEQTNLSHKFLSEQLVELINKAKAENDGVSNPRRVEMHFPPTLSPDNRKRIHILAQQYGLHTESVGVGAARYLRVLVPPNHGIKATASSNDSSSSSSGGNNKGKQEKPAKKMGRLAKKSTGLSEILEDFLYLGGGRDARDTRMLQSMGITRVLNVASEWQVSQHPDIDHLHIKLMDYESEDISSHFGTGIDYIERARRDNQRILVHCVMGKSRSVSFVLAYLMQMKDMHLRTAFEYVYARRNVIKPNRGFMQTLIAYEKQLYPSLERPTISVDEWVGIVGEHGFANRKLKVKKEVVTQHHPVQPAQPGEPTKEQKLAALFEEHFPEQAALDALSQLPLKKASTSRAIQVGRSLLEGDQELLGKLRLLRCGIKDLFKLSDEKVKAMFNKLLSDAGIQ